MSHVEGRCGTMRETSPGVGSLVLGSPAQEPVAHLWPVVFGVRLRPKICEQ